MPPDKTEQERPPGISVFFPAYNDGGTIPSMVLTALMTLWELTDDSGGIVVNGYKISRFDPLRRAIISP